MTLNLPQKRLDLLGRGCSIGRERHTIPWRFIA